MSEVTKGAPRPRNSAKSGERNSGGPKSGGSKSGASRAGRQAAKTPRLAWTMPLVFALLAPLLFMTIDMSVEQVTSSSGFSISRLAGWIAEDGFYALRAVYLVGVVPAAFAGLILARREQRGGATTLFVLVVLLLFALPVAVLFARNLFLFAPPPLEEQLLIGLRVVAGVVISGFVCYAVGRWIARERR